MDKKKVAPKKPVDKKATSKIKLVSYKMGMVIPTDDYANIQPEIVVEGGTMQEAHDFIAPHMNKLWKEYYLIGRRRKEVVTPTPAPTPAPVAQPEVTSPASSVAMVKATQAIQSCMSIDALDIIQNQVLVSVKLTEEDQKNLMPLIEAKREELNGKQTEANPA